MIKDTYHWRLQTTLAIIAGYATLVPKKDIQLTVIGFLELHYGWQQYTATNSLQSINTGTLRCGKFTIKSLERT